MKHKTSTLTGPELDAAVALAEGLELSCRSGESGCWVLRPSKPFNEVMPFDPSSA